MSAPDAGRGGSRPVGAAPVAAVLGAAAAGVRGSQTRDQAGGVGIGGVSGIGASGHDRPEPAGSALTEMETLGAWRADGTVADGCGGRLPAGRWQLRQGVDGN